MKLDERVKKDLSELYNGGNTPGEIQCAVELEGLIAAKPGQTSFATKALPGYYAGNRKADTVLVMLNPGMSVCEANCRLMYDIERYSMKDANDIENYHQCCANYGYIDKSRLDNFDLKQAFFLHNWEQTGIELPIDLRSTMTRKSDMGTLLKAKEAVLTQKLQLELVPYASSSFNNINKSKIKLLIPFVETLFDEIFAHERKYVIFCSHIFVEVFKEYNKEHYEAIKCLDEDPVKGKLLKNKNIIGSCKIVYISYNNKSIKALIANTFTHQALPNAYHLMEKYGDFCYQQYLSHR